MSVAIESKKVKSGFYLEVGSNLVSIKHFTIDFNFLEMIHVLKNPHIAVVPCMQYSIKPFLSNIVNEPGE